MRYPRLTLRRAMILVAAIALSLGIPLEAHRLVKLRTRYLGMLAENDRWGQIHRRVARDHEAELARLRADASPGDDTRAGAIEQARRRVSDSAAVVEIYARREAILRRLASHPWEPVPRDPADRRRPEQDQPVLIVPTSAGPGLEFSSGLIARTALIPAMLILGGIALFAAHSRRGDGRFRWLGRDPARR